MIKMGSGLHDNNKLSIMLAMISTIIIMMIVMIKMGSGLHGNRECEERSGLT